MMKILIISPQVPVPLNDGGKKGIFGIMKYLSLRGHDIDFIAYLKHNNIESSEKELRKYCKPFLLDIKTDNKILDAILNLFSPLPYNVSKYHRKELTKYLKSYFEINNPNIIQIHNSHMGWLITHIKAFTKAPVILRQENAEMIIMKRFYENQKNPLLKKYSKIQYKKFIAYEPKVCGIFDKCIFVSQYDQKVLSDLNSKVNSISIPSGVESSLLNHAPVDTEKYSLAHIGNLDWLPNADSLQWFINDILPGIAEHFNSVKLYIYGAGNFNRIRIPDNLKNNIVYKGYVPDIWSAIENKSLLVVPLRIGSGIRIKILEMLAYGKNIITTSIGKEGIDIKNEKHILIADDKEQFVKKIVKFFNGDYDKEEMINNGKRFIKENYLWEDIAYQFEQVYSKLITQNRK